MDGVLAGFPNTYAEKVGKTSDAMSPRPRSGHPCAGPEATLKAKLGTGINRHE